ncbi:glutathione S-transferase family protein [Burkholderia plantarii]|uniref:glutathione S-transferase family protein n=1 Tax=Burkholderia plantarii TaxID=41899 RepID=UPI0018DDE847|nr:glutathione S-transferase family protein [Burkholderia plantarii]MBI0326200.1 glutathione S-transferase family protein [Burkholderia plantarii]
MNATQAAQAPRLTLISHPLCPFVQRAAIVLHEKGLLFERVDIDLHDKPDWFVALSPTGKVPLLEVRDRAGRGGVLFESMAICEYAEDLGIGARLYPDDAFARAGQRAWIEFASAMLGDAWGYLNAADEDAARARGAALRRKLQRVEAELRDGPYFAGAAFGMVDAVVAPVFRYFDRLDAEAGDELFDALGKVARWRAALAARPSVIAAVGGDYRERLLAHLRARDAWVVRA